MRYTKKITKNYGCKMNDYMWKDNSYNHSRLGIDKLGQLENVEEEMGVDLVKLLSAKEIWVKTTDIDKKKKEYINVIKSYKDTDYTFAIQPESGIIYFYGKKDGIIYHYLMLKKYGKTWAFSEEELKEQ